MRFGGKLSKHVKHSQTPRPFRIEVTITCIAPVPTLRAKLCVGTSGQWPLVYRRKVRVVQTYEINSSGAGDLHFADVRKAPAELLDRPGAIAVGFTLFSILMSRKQTEVGCLTRSLGMFTLMPDERFSLSTIYIP